MIQSGDFLLPDKLQKVTVPIVGDAACAEAYYHHEITPSMICAGLEEGIDRSEFVIFSMHVFSKLSFNIKIRYYH